MLTRGQRSEPYFDHIKEEIECGMRKTAPFTRKQNYADGNCQATTTYYASEPQGLLVTSTKFKALQIPNGPSDAEILKFQDLKNNCEMTIYHESRLSFLGKTLNIDENTSIKSTEFAAASYLLEQITHNRYHAPAPVMENYAYAMTPTVLPISLFY